jgi:hypothetical protein
MPNVSDLSATFQAGDIIVLNNMHGGWYSKVQRFFTRLPYTHTGIVFYPVFGEPSYFGADMSVDIQPIQRFLSSSTCLYQLYRPNCDYVIKDYVLHDLYVRYAGETYGFWQILWFVYRWVMESFHVDVRKQHNWFPDHEICSEIGWNYVNNWYSLFPNTHVQALADLNMWRPDTFSSGDMARFLQAHPEDFTLVDERWLGPR